LDIFFDSFPITSEIRLAIIVPKIVIIITLPF
jgi:hypothetical protein